VHLVGGLWGCLSIGFFGSSAINSLGLNGIFYGGGTALLGKQAFGAFFVLTYSFIVTLIIGFAIDKTIGLRVKEEAEVSGIDYDQHAETGYELTTSSSGGFRS
jgi:Amt family ammonium transporter